MTPTQPDAGKLLPCPEAVERTARALCKLDECDPDAKDYKDMPQWMERRYFEDARKLVICGLDETYLTICELGGTFALHFHQDDTQPIWQARDYQGAYDIREAVLNALYRLVTRPTPQPPADVVERVARAIWDFDKGGMRQHDKDRLWADCAQGARKGDTFGYKLTMDMAKALCKAIPEFQAAGTVPAGWKMVPEVPTLEMLTRIMAGMNIGIGQARRIYLATIAAAPER